jgi:hypothetical protein
MGTNQIALKALKDHGLIGQDNALRIMVGSNNRIRRAYINAKLHDLLGKFESVQFYAEAAQICKEIIDLALDYPDNISIGNPVSDRIKDTGIQGTEGGHQYEDRMSDLDRILNVDDPRKIPLEIRTKIIDHYITLMEESPLITEEDFKVSAYSDRNLTDILLDDEEYRSKVIRTVVNASCNSPMSDNVVDDILKLGLSYKEMIMGGYFLSVINRVRLGMKKTNEEAGQSDNLIMDNIFNVCIPYSLGIALNEFSISELRVKLEETLMISEENV